MLDQRYRDTAPPADWQPKSAFFKALWRKLDLELIERIRIPFAGRMTCPNCRQSFAVSLHVDEPLD